MILANLPSARHGARDFRMSLPSMNDVALPPIRHKADAMGAPHDYASMCFGVMGFLCLNGVILFIVIFSRQRCWP
jgi:hypothetical protein